MRVIPAARFRDAVTLLASIGLEPVRARIEWIGEYDIEKGGELGTDLDAEADIAKLVAAGGKPARASLKVAAGRRRASKGAGDFVIVVEFERKADEEEEEAPA